MKKYLEFVSLDKGKYVNVNYKIIMKDPKDSPVLLVSEFNIVKSEDKKVEIKAKGYIYTNLGLEDNKKKGWIQFDDFVDNKTRIVWNKHFENGSKRIKVFKF